MISTKFRAGMRQVSIGALCCTALVGTAGAALSPPQSSMDSDPLKKLRSAKSVSFVADTGFKLPASDESKDWQLGVLYKVTLARPALVHIAGQMRTNVSNVKAPGADGSTGRFEVGMAAPSYHREISDGARWVGIDDRKKTYCTEAAPKNLADVDRIRAGYSICFDILFAHPAKTLKRTGTRKENGQNLIEYRTEVLIEGAKGVEGKEVYDLSINPVNRLPARLLKTTMDNDGKIFEINRVQFSDWKINGRIPTETFSPQPAEGYQKAPVTDRFPG